MFGFDTPVPLATPNNFEMGHTAPSLQPSDPTGSNSLFSSPTITVPQLNEEDEDDYSYAADGPFLELKRNGLKGNHITPAKVSSSAIDTKSFHTSRKISPPLNRPDHLRFT